MKAINKLQSILFAVSMAGELSGSSQAADLVFELNNMSGKSVMSVFATPKDESTASQVNLLVGQVAAGETGEITISAQDTPICVYDLNLHFDDGSGLDRPDVDLCQTDQLIVE